MAAAAALQALPCSQRSVASSRAFAPTVSVAAPQSRAVVAAGALRIVRFHGAALRHCRRRAARRVAAACTLVVAAADAQAAEALWRMLGSQGVDTSAVRPTAVPEGLGLVCTRCVPTWCGVGAR